MGLIRGLIESDRLEKQARETNMEAMEMLEDSRKKLSQQRKRAEQALRILSVRKQGTIENLKNFKGTMQRIIDLGAIIDDHSLDALESFSINIIEKYQSMPKLDVNILSDKQILATFFTPLNGGIGGIMIKDAQISNEVAEAKWDAAKAIQSSKNAETDIWAEVEKLTLMQKESLSKMNSFFNKSVGTVKKLLDENGDDIGNYSEYQLQQILVCCKSAKILNAIVQTVMMGQDYKITQQAQKVYNITDNFIKEVESLQRR